MNECRNPSYRNRNIRQDLLFLRLNLLSSILVDLVSISPGKRIEKKNPLSLHMSR